MSEHETDLATLPPAPNGTGDVENVAPPVIDETSPRRSKDSWLSSPGDLELVDIPLDVINDTVTVRGMSVGELAAIGMVCKGPNGVLIDKMMAMQLAAGVVEPKMSENEWMQQLFKFGPMIKLVIDEIDRLSASSPQDVEKAKARFRPRR